MSIQLDLIFRTSIRTIHKVEYMECYVKAKKAAITTLNILSGWRGAGLFSINKHCILHQISVAQTSNHPSTLPTTSLRLLNTMSPPNYDILQSTNRIFNTKLAQTMVTSPIKTHTCCLAEITVWLAAENAILKKDLWAQIWKQKERAKEKWVVLKNDHAICPKSIMYWLNLKGLQKRQGFKCTQEVSRGWGGRQCRECIRW